MNKNKIKIVGGIMRKLSQINYDLVHENELSEDLMSFLNEMEEVYKNYLWREIISTHFSTKK